MMFLFVTFLLAAAAINGSILSESVDPFPHHSSEEDSFSKSPMIQYPLPSRCRQIVPIETRYTYSDGGDSNSGAQKTMLLKKEKTIYTIGDGSSLLGMHTLFAHKSSFHKKNIQSLHWVNYWMGSIPMQTVIDEFNSIFKKHNLSDDDNNENNINTINGILNFKSIINPKNGSIIAVSFGEIDARINIPLYSTHQGKGSIREISKELVRSYEKILLWNKRLLAEEADPSISFWIIGLAPPMRAKQPMSIRDRQLAVAEVNHFLKDMCKRNSWFYLDRSSNYVDGEGFLRKDLSDGRMHIMQYTSDTADAITTEMTRQPPSIHKKTEPSPKRIEDVPKRQRRAPQRPIKLDRPPAIHRLIQPQAQ